MSAATRTGHVVAVDQLEHGEGADRGERALAERDLPAMPVMTVIDRKIVARTAAWVTRKSQRLDRPG